LILTFVGGAGAAVAPSVTVMTCPATVNVAERAVLFGFAATV
jgi:hypothetical protein